MQKHNMTESKDDKGADKAVERSTKLSAEIITHQDPSKFQRLKKYSVMAYRPVNPNATELVVWGSYDTLLEAVNKFNRLTEYEHKTAYIMKNIVWQIEAKEVEL